MGFHSSKAAEALPGDSFLFTIQFPRVTCNQLIDLKKMKSWVDLGATQWFWTREFWKIIGFYSHVAWLISFSNWSNFAIGGGGVGKFMGKGGGGGGVANIIFQNFNGKSVEKK